MKTGIYGFSVFSRGVKKIEKLCPAFFIPCIQEAPEKSEVSLRDGELS